MLKTTVQKIRDTAIVRCQGRIIVGENFATLRDAVMKHSSAAMVVLDLAGVKRIDAGGLGALLGLRNWAESNAIRFKLMNVMPRVERLLKLTKLDRVFEFWSLRDMFCLVLLAQLQGAADIPIFRERGYAAFPETLAAGR
jgi:anti-anti-sigma factor